jgi:hypothetical protein
MPTSKLFLLEILVNGQPLEEFIPQQDDYNYPACSNLPVSELDRVCYIQASPGSEFTARITYLGSDRLSIHYAYNVYLFVDGQEIGGVLFCDGKAGLVELIEAKHVAGNLEQPYIFVSNQA